MGLRDRLRGLVARTPSPPRPAPRAPERPPPVHPAIGVRVPVAGGVAGAERVRVGEAAARAPGPALTVVDVDRWEAAAEAEWLAACGHPGVGWLEDPTCAR